MPIKTRVYFVETVEQRDAFYRCADFCVPGGTLAGGAVDLAKAIADGCPLILGPKMPDNAVRQGLLAAGAAVWARGNAEIVDLAKAWLSDPAAAKAAAGKAKAWWGQHGA